VLACTNARDAQSLTDDEDPADRRYLSGARTIEGFHVYCGGIDAAISRGLAYAPHADVICYRASTLDLAEADRFASAMRGSFPGKQLGVGFSPSSHRQRNGTEDGNRDKILRKLGYDYYFRTDSGSAAFPSFPHARPWALFDDGGEPADASAFEETPFC
jgi:isocitrate lyase